MTSRMSVATVGIALVAGAYLVWRGDAADVSNGKNRAVSIAGARRGNPASAGPGRGIGEAPRVFLPRAVQPGGGVGRGEKDAPGARLTSIDRAASWATDFEGARMNIFRDDDDFVRRLIARDEQAVGRLADFLKEGPEVDRGMQGLRHGSPVGDVRARMGALNLLEAIARVGATEESARDAQDALRSIGTREIAPGGGSAAKAVMVGEKYDALVSLTRLDPQAAFDAFRSIRQADRRKVLAPALMAGLVDRGVERSQVVAEFNRLLGE
jgi:hypothetical protein